MNNIFRIAFTYIASILGAGFATGREMLSFFSIYGNVSIISFVFSCFLLSFFAVCILYKIIDTEADNYSHFLNKIYGNTLGKLIQIFNIFFLFIIFSAMIAGGENILSSFLYFDNILCSLIFCTILFFSLIFGSDMILKLNTILCPIILIGGIYIGVYINFFQTFEVFSNSIKPFVSSTVYATYNTITTIAILFSLRDKIKNKYIAICSGVMSGVFIFLIGLFLLLAINSNIDIIRNENLPILKLISNTAYIKIVYIIILMIAIYTTAIGNGFALVDNFQHLFKNNPKVEKRIFVFFMILFGYMFSKIGFSSIIDNIYPIFGYIGFFQVLVICLNVIFCRNHID